MDTMTSKEETDKILQSEKTNLPQSEKKKEAEISANDRVCRKKKYPTRKEDKYDSKAGPSSRPTEAEVNDEIKAQVTDEHYKMDKLEKIDQKLNEVYYLNEDLLPWRKRKPSTYKFEEIKIPRQEASSSLWPPDDMFIKDPSLLTYALDEAKEDRRILVGTDDDRFIPDNRYIQDSEDFIKEDQEDHEYPFKDN